MDRNQNNSLSKAGLTCGIVSMLILPAIFESESLTLFLSISKPFPQGPPSIYFGIEPPCFKP